MSIEQQHESISDYRPEEVPKRVHLQAVPDLSILPDSGKTFIDADGVSHISYAHLDFTGIHEEVLKRGLPDTEHNRLQCAIDRHTNRKI